MPRFECFLEVLSVLDGVYRRAQSAVVVHGKPGKTAFESAVHSRLRALERLLGTRLGLYSYVRRECGGCGLKDDGAVMTQEEWESRPLKQIAYDCGYRHVLGLYAGSSAYEGKDGQSFAHERLLSYLMYAGTQAGHNLVALGRAPSTPENTAAAKENFGILSKAYEQFRDTVPPEDTGPTFYEIIFNSEEPEELRRCAGRRVEEIKPEEFA